MPMQRAPVKPAPAKKAQPPPSPSAAAPAVTSPTAGSGGAAAAGASPPKSAGANASALKQAAAVNPISSSLASSSSSVPTASSALTSPTGGSVKVVKAPRTGYALVKAVQSGDTLVVIGNAPSGQSAPEKTIIISGIQAPRFAKGKNQTDEVRGCSAAELSA
jgi:hypothetical protein